MGLVSLEETHTNSICNKGSQKRHVAVGRSNNLGNEGIEAVTF